ncbi:hypothetical protein [Picosynechococcus sp. NKBG042902]|uniref:hypothetical protein n=1 Tax=Picosynechococcus sp. NKBG042902 TaxID=490193 RepID=UPI0004AABCDB|nr:hypothetical protein [Picosynechococcus sp. NKBG042902]
MYSKAYIQAILVLFLFTGITAPGAYSNEESEDLNPQDFPVFNQGDWRSAKADGLPWSTPVIIKDEFDGDQLAVYDRNMSGSMFWFGKEAGIISIWGERIIRIIQFERKNTFFSGEQWTTKEAENFSIKIGEDVFTLNGENGNFLVTEELAVALRDAPEEETRMKIRLEDSGTGIFNDIGVGTVRAWKTVYAQSQSVHDSDLEQENKPEDIVNPPIDEDNQESQSLNINSTEDASPSSNTSN